MRGWVGKGGTRGWRGCCAVSAGEGMGGTMRVGYLFQMHGNERLRGEGSFQKIGVGVDVAGRGREGKGGRKGGRKGEWVCWADGTFREG